MHARAHSVQQKHPKKAIREITKQSAKHGFSKCACNATLENCLPEIANLTVVCQPDRKANKISKNIKYEFHKSSMNRDELLKHYCVGQEL